jgi:hypothetical protein
MGLSRGTDQQAGWACNADKLKLTLFVRQSTGV